MVEWLERRMESTVRYLLFPIVISFLYTLIIINIKIIQKYVFYPQKPAKMTHNDENMMLVIFGVVGEADFVYKLLIVQLKIII